MEFFIHSSMSQDEKNLKWSCIFLPDNGAFFVNYVITCALVGTALELMRFSELFVYAFRLLFARSVAETPSVRRANLYEFMFGFNYGWMLLVFAMTAAYAVICPVITPFGLLYLVMKHGVDRYNLYYAYKRSKINKNIHATAVNCVMASLLLQQLILLFFNVVRSSDKSDHNKILSPRAIFSLTMLVLFSLMFFAQMFFHMFKGISPLQYSLPRHGGRSPRGGSSDPEADELPQRNGGIGEEEHIGGDLNALSNHRRRRKHKQFVPDVLRRDHFAAQPLVSTDEMASTVASTRSGGLTNRRNPSLGAQE